MAVPLLSTCRQTALILSALSCLGCWPEAPPRFPTHVKLQLGTADPRLHGDLRWVDLADGQEVELYPGSQGGFHIWLHYRISGVAGRIHVKRIADRLRGDPERRDRVLTTDAFMTILLPEESTAPPAWETEHPIPSFMCPTPIGINVIGERIEMILRISSEDERPLAEERVRVVPRCPPKEDNQHEFCNRICSG